RHKMTEAQAEYERMLKADTIQTSEEFWEAYLKLCEAMDRLKMERNNICNNDEKIGDPYP
ncbi:MAG: hypothetical protein V1753_06515, partial [Pseudomonadota bacterium]